MASNIDVLNDLSVMMGGMFSPDGVRAAILVEISQLKPDPEQPRKIFDEDSLQELADSIRERGIICPISVKITGRSNNEYIINHGERRWRAAQLAGLTRVPVILGENHNEFDQVIENIQRDNLTALEVAEFIDKQKSKGHTNDEIAKQIGKSKQWVANHSVLVNLPACIQVLIEAGIVEDVNRLMILVNAHKKHPLEIEALCNDHGADFSRSVLQAFIRSLDTGILQRPPAVAVNQTEIANDSLVLMGESKEIQDISLDREVNLIAEAKEKEVKPVKENDPTKMKSPILHVVVDGRGAALLIKKRPSQVGFFWVKFLDDGAECEFIADDVRLDMLIDG